MGYEDGNVCPNCRVDAAWGDADDRSQVRYILLSQKEFPLLYNPSSYDRDKSGTPGQDFLASDADYFCAGCTASFDASEVDTVGAWWTSEEA